MKRSEAEKEAEKVWDKLLAFSSYGFNRSHAAAYGVMAYESQWMKANYPAEFFTVSLNNIRNTNKSSMIMIAHLIDEMCKICNVELKPSSINLSGSIFYYDLQTNCIYWSIGRIKGIGSKTAQKLLEERKRGGKFQNMKEFLIRMKAAKFLRKNVITGLILSGAFDELENIKEVKERKSILEKLYNFIDEDLPVVYESPKLTKNHNWLLLERENTGYAKLDLKKIIANKSVIISKQYIDVETFESAKDYTKAAIAGTIVNYTKRKSVRGEFGQIMLLSNTKVIYITAWNDKWEEFKKDIEIAKKEQTIVCFTGVIKRDSYKEENVLYTDSNTSKMILL